MAARSWFSMTAVDSVRDVRFTSNRIVRLAVAAWLAATLAGCGAPDEGPAGPSTSPATAEEPTTASTASTPLASSIQPAPDVKEFPSALCCRGSAIDPATYRTPAWFGIPLSLEVGTGWNVMNERAAMLLALVRGDGNSLGNPDELIVWLDASAAGSVDTLLTQLRGEASFSDLSDPTDVVYGGRPGRRFDATVPVDPEYQGRPADDIPAGVRPLDVIEQYFAPGFVWTNNSPDARLGMVALDLGSTILLVVIEAPPDDFDTFAADAEVILESLSPVE